MVLYSEFSSENGHKYYLEINAIGVDKEDKDVDLGGTPVILTTDSSKIFDPIKSRSLSIQLVSYEWYFDLYSIGARDVSVKLYDDTDKTVFRGWLTPAAYSQNFNYLDTIELEAADAISTTKYFDYQVGNGYIDFQSVILSILKSAGYQGDLYIPKTYDLINGKTFQDTVLSNLKVSSSNFIDDDEEKSPWKEYDVLYEIAQFMGWSFVPTGDDVWLIDYKKEVEGKVTYEKYSIISGQKTGEYVSDSKDIEIKTEDMAGGESKIDIDDIYNKIEISDNLYEIEDICTDIFDDDNHISIMDEIGADVNGSQWVKTETKKFLWWVTNKTEEITGYDYQTICRLNSNSGWEHRYYQKSDLIELPNKDGKGYYNPDSNSDYKNGAINKYVNTVGCLIQHYAHRKNEGKNNLPNRLDWTDIMTFFITDDTTNNSKNFSLFSISQFELPVLEYTNSEVINYTPTSGTNWLYIKGDLFYQYQGAKYGEKGKKVLNIVNTKNLYYTTAPVDKAVDIDESKYCSLTWDYKHYKDDRYGTGFSTWKMKLQIGDKYWDGDNWTTDKNATFYIKYNNNPSDKADEYFPAFTWMKCVDNTDYKDKVGQDAYCIPIHDTDVVNGQLKLTIYVPRLLPVEMEDRFKAWFRDSYLDMSWMNFPPVIFCKNFELGMVYTDGSKWWSNHEVDKNKKDKVYTGYINDNSVNEFDGLTFKINTSVEDRPISRSYVILSDGKYLKTLRHEGSDSKTQEYNIVDLYLDHYSDRKVIYTRAMEGYFTPDKTFYKTSLGGKAMVIDSQEYDIRSDNNTVKFIEF